MGAEQRTVFVEVLAKGEAEVFSDRHLGHDLAHEAFDELGHFVGLVVGPAELAKGVGDAPGVEVAFFVDEGREGLADSDGGHPFVRFQLLGQEKGLLVVKDESPDEESPVLRNRG